jgi:hypothetical protein
MRVKRVVIVQSVCLLLIGLGARAGDDLNDVAKRDAERRAKQKSDKPVRSFGDGDLSKAKGSGFSQLEGEGAASAPPSTDSPTSSVRRTPINSSSPGTPSGEAGWRSRAKQARERVATLEAEVQRLDGVATGKAYGTGSGSCGNGGGSALNPHVMTPDEKASFDDCVRKQANNTEHTEALGRLAAAREQLAAAKLALENLEEEARRARVPPGWLRE